MEYLSQEEIQEKARLIPDLLRAYLEQDGIIEAYIYNCKYKRTVEAPSNAFNKEHPKSDSIIDQFRFSSTDQGHDFWWRHHIAFEGIKKSSKVKEKLLETTDVKASCDNHYTTGSVYYVLFDVEEAQSEDGYKVVVSGLAELEKYHKKHWGDRKILSIKHLCSDVIIERS